MRQQGNGYLLTLSLLIAAYVRHHQDEDGDDEVAAAETSLRSLDRSRGSFIGEAAERGKRIARESTHALASFLVTELQDPCATAADTASPTVTTATSTAVVSVDPYALCAVFQRLRRAIPRLRDYTVLQDELLAIFARIDSPDAVSDIVDGISECVAPLARTASGEVVEPFGDSTSSLLVRRSVFGIFVRKFVLSVNRLLFDGLARLYDELSRYNDAYAEPTGESRQTSDLSLSISSSPATQSLWRPPAPGLDDLTLSPIARTNNEPPSMTSSTLKLPSLEQSPALCHHKPPSVALSLGPFALSEDQRQYLLHDLIHRIERGLSLDMTTKRATLLASTTTDGLFVKYLDAVNQHEYDTALAALHEYHDFALATTQRLRLALRASRQAAGTATVSASMAPMNRLHFLGSGVQYASLNLAGLNIMFNRLPAAHESLHETIRVAQHHGDHICVAFALSWLVRIQQMEGVPKDQVAALVGNTIERSKELQLPSLQALAVLSGIDHGLQTGSSAPAISAFVSVSPSPRPLELWEQLDEVRRIIDAIGDTLPTSSASGSGNGLQNRSLGQLMFGPNSNTGNTSKRGGMRWKQSVESVLNTLWSLHGKSLLAAAQGWRLFGHRSLEDLADGIFWSEYKQQAPLCEIAGWISRRAITLSEFHENGDFISGNVFTNALTFIADAVDGHPHGEVLFQNKCIQITIHRLMMKWAMNRGEWLAADSHLKHILSLSPETGDFSAYLTAQLLHAALDGEREQFQDCFYSLHRLELLCHQRDYDYLLAQVLITSSVFQCRAGSTNGPYEALPCALRAVDICSRNRFDLLLAEAHLTIAEIYITMGRNEDAIDLLQRQMPLVTESRNLRLRAQSQVILAKATFAHYRSKGIRGDDSPLHQCIKLLSSSYKIFEFLDAQIGLLEVHLLKTFILRESEADGEVVEHASIQFVHIDECVRNAQLTTFEYGMPILTSRDLKLVVDSRMKPSR